MVVESAELLLLSLPFSVTRVFFSFDKRSKVENGRKKRAQNATPTFTSGGYRGKFTTWRSSAVVTFQVH